MRLAGCQLWAEALLMLSTVSVCHENIQALCLNSLLGASVHAQSWQCDGGKEGVGATFVNVIWEGTLEWPLMQFSDLAGQFMPRREKKTAGQILFNCCAWEKVAEMTVLCHCQLSLHKQKGFMSSFKNMTANHCGFGTSLGCQENRGVI